METYFEVWLGQNPEQYLKMLDEKKVDEKKVRNDNMKPIKMMAMMVLLLMMMMVVVLMMMM